jgi:predicted transcriptional regulator
VIERIRHGLEAADRGEIIIHEEVTLQMQKWLKK